MSFRKAPEVNGFSETNGHAHQDKQNESKTLVVAKKVFVHRNSALTDLMETNPHIRSLYNLIFAISILLTVYNVLLYYADPSIMWDDISVLQFSVSKFPNFIAFWLTLNLIAFAHYEGFRLWIIVRNKINSKVADKIFLFLYIVSYFSTLIGTAVSMIKTGMGPVAAFALADEQMRIYMKIHSFVRENIPRVLHHKLENENQNNTLCPTRKQYLYFLFAPTLVYRDSYLRTKTRSTRKILHHLFEIFTNTYAMGFIFLRFHKDALKNTGLQPFTKTGVVFLFAGSLFTGGLQLFIMNYGIFHTWLNFTSELLRFADREFYQDWWNTSDFMNYYRKWNFPVHEWLHTFIYADSRRLGCSPLFSLSLTFCISSFFHDYVFWITCGYFYPLFMLVHFSCGVLFSFLPGSSKRLGEIKWFGLFSMWGALISLHVIEWYARKNCPKEETFIDSFKLRTLDPSCQILDFSFF